MAVAVLVAVAVIVAVLVAVLVSCELTVSATRLKRVFAVSSQRRHGSKGARIVQPQCSWDGCRVEPLTVADRDDACISVITPKPKMGHIIAHTIQSDLPKKNKPIQSDPKKTKCPHKVTLFFQARAQASLNIPQSAGARPSTHHGIPVHRPVRAGSRASSVPAFVCRGRSGRRQVLGLVHSPVLLVILLAPVALGVGRSR
jgi:hypothetical protein